MTGTEAALQLLIIAVSHANELGVLLQNAHAQNRDVTDAEIDGLRAKYDTVRAALLADIAARGGITPASGGGPGPKP